MSIKSNLTKDSSLENVKPGIEYICLDRNSNKLVSKVQSLLGLDIALFVVQKVIPMNLSLVNY